MSSIAIPQPRFSVLGSTGPVYAQPWRYDLDTWIEDESFAYPAGGFTRRARVCLPDGSFKVVRCSIPDTFFTIPAKAVLVDPNDKTIRRVVNGYVSVQQSNGLSVLTFSVPTNKGV